MSEGNRDNIIKLSSASDSVFHWTPAEALEECLSELDDPECDTDGIVIIRVSRANGNFMVSRLCSKLKKSEVVAALEIAKLKELDLL